MAKITSVKVSKKYQIAVPAEARQLLHIKTGDRLLVDIQDGMIILLPKPDSYSRALQGLHHGIWENLDIDQYITGERNAWTGSSNE